MDRKEMYEACSKVVKIIETRCNVNTEKAEELFCSAINQRRLSWKIADWAEFLLDMEG